MKPPDAFAFEPNPDPVAVDEFEEASALECWIEVKVC